MWSYGDKYLPASTLIELLGKLSPDTMIVPSSTKNLVCLTHEGEEIGVITFSGVGEIEFWELGK